MLLADTEAGFFPAAEVKSTEDCWNTQLEVSVRSNHSKEVKKGGQSVCVRVCERVRALQLE